MARIMAPSTPKAGTKRRRPSLLCLLAAAAASPLAGGAAVPRPAAATSGWEARAGGADVPQTQRAAGLSGAGDEHEDVLPPPSPAKGAGRSAELGGAEDESLAAGGGAPLHLRHPSYPSHPSHQPNGRHLLLDGTLPPQTGALRHSPYHEKLETAYAGEISSSSVEFSLGNQRTDGKRVIVSGLGMHVQIVDEKVGYVREEVACRVKVYTRRRPAATAEGAAAEEGATEEATEEYALALDAKVLCAGQGKETLLNSDLFLQSYRQGQTTKSAARAAGWTFGGGGGGRRNLDAVENADEGTLPVAEDSPTSNATDATAENTGGPAAAERTHPLLIAPAETLSFYVVVMPLDDAGGKTFLFLSSPGASTDGDVTTIEDGTAARLALEGSPGPVYLSSYPPSLTLHEGASVINGRTEAEGGEGGGTAVDETTVLQVKRPTVLDGAVYYDVLDPATTTLDEYYDELQYSLLPGDPPHDASGCDRTFDTGYVDTVGSYGVMFDLSNAAEAVASAWGETKEDSFLGRFRNVEVYGLDLYVRNVVNASFEVYVRKDASGGYASYMDPAGQTLIGENWELVAAGIVEGRGPGVGSPLPLDAWRKTVVVKPGQSVGFYVTVPDGPHIRYRNSTLPEGAVYAGDDVVTVGVGRAWGEHDLRGDGTDVYFAPRQFSGAVRYRVSDGGLCPAAPTLGPTVSPAPTGAREHSYAALAEEGGLCPEEGRLETGFEDGTGSYGALFDVLAERELTLTGIDLNVDWNSGPSTHLLVYARQGSWFGHQNNADSWPYLVVNATIERPPDFHNRSEDGAFIPIEAKRNSAIVPARDFAPLPMKAGETWSLYVCMSSADFRYTLGTSIGKAFASNAELRAMEGAGAADYPPFRGGTPENGGAEYTFYAPRQFNGNLRYDYVADCPSEPPSGVFSTPAPTPVPTLTTSVSYTFYVEHSADKLKGAVTYDMSFGVQAVLEKYLSGGEDILSGHALRDELAIERVVANLVSPTDIGYLCYPEPPDTCTPISVDVTATHRATATTEEITYALLQQSMHLPNQIAVEGYTIEYVGDRAVETNSEITLSNVPGEMPDNVAGFFEDVAREFLADHVTDDSDNDSLQILSVTVNGQEITSDAEQTDAVIQARNVPQRRLEQSNNIQVSIKGKYRPPPEVNFGDLVESSINRDRELLQKELKEREPPPSVQGQDEGAFSNYFEKAEVVGARQIKEVPTPLSAAVQNDQEWKGWLNYVAMGVGGLIALLSALFLLRPHRRRAMLGIEKVSQRRTQPVNVEDQGLIKQKSRAAIRGWGSEAGSEYDPRNSSNTEMLRLSRFSEFSSGGQPPFDPRGSNASGHGGERLCVSERGPLMTSDSERLSLSERGPPTLSGIGGMDQRGLGRGSFRVGAPPGRGQPAPGPFVPERIRMGPQRLPPPPDEGFHPHNSMPPVRGGGPRPMPTRLGPHNSMPPLRAGARMMGQESGAPRGARIPPTYTMSMQNGPPTRQMHDPRRNQSMMPQHDHRQGGYR